MPIRPPIRIQSGPGRSPPSLVTQKPIAAGRSSPPLRAANQPNIDLRSIPTLLQTAYEVFDEYADQGRKFAEGRSGWNPGTEAMGVGAQSIPTLALDPSLLDRLQKVFAELRNALAAANLDVPSLGPLVQALERSVSQAAGATSRGPADAESLAAEVTQPIRQVVQNSLTDWTVRPANEPSRPEPPPARIEPPRRERPVSEPPVRAPPVSDPSSANEPAGRGGGGIGDNDSYKSAKLDDDLEDARASASSGAMDTIEKRLQRGASRGFRGRLSGFEPNVDLNLDDGVWGRRV